MYFLMRCKYRNFISQSKPNLRYFPPYSIEKKQLEELNNQKNTFIVQYKKQE